MQAAHALARGAEHQAGARLEVAQHVHRRALAVVRGHGDGAVLDVAVRLAPGARVDPQGVALVAAGEGGDLLGDGGAEQQGAALGGGGVEDELQVLAEAQVEHLVGLVEHDGAQVPQVQPPALQVIAQAARRAHDDMAAGGQHPLLGPAVHAADAGGDAGAGRAVQPGQLALHLHRQLARRGDQQGERGAGLAEPLLAAEQRRGQGQAVGDGLAGPGLGGHQQVAALRLRHQDGGLHGGRLRVLAGVQGTVEGRVDGREGHRSTSSAACGKAAEPGDIGHDPCRS